jgi:hypothetical protein
MMQELLEKMPKSQEEKRLVVSTRLFNALMQSPRKMVCEASLTQRV